MPREMPITHPLDITVKVYYQSDLVRFDDLSGVGYIKEENSGTLVIEDRRGMAVRKYHRDKWLKYVIEEYKLLDDVEVEYND